ncbi:MAG TPA: alpha/beta hydrolase [Pyrinomonadaceae bacterium]|nr:alpha/beta hydrolase [Pyrinomonadaceae bacterium]
MPKVSVNRFRLYYEMEGDGEPVVLIPGFASGRETWAMQTPSLSRNFRVITFDPRGVSESDKPEGPQSISLFADDVAHLLQALGISRAHIVGASFGGFVAQEFALRYPFMTRKLVLCCTSFGGPNHVQPEPETLKMVASARRLNVGQFEAATNFDVESRVEGIRSQTLVVSGDADEIVPVQNSRNLAAKIPGATLRIVEGGSHTFFSERAEEFNKLLTDFLL